MSDMKNDRKYLLNVGDGPEGLAIYTSEDEDTVNWLDGAVYVEFSDINTYFKGTLTLRAIREGIKAALSVASRVPAPLTTQTVSRLLRQIITNGTSDGGQCATWIQTALPCNCSECLAREALFVLTGERN